MAYLASRNTPASAPGGHTWDTPDDVVELPDDEANELLSIFAAGFYEILPGDPKHPDTETKPRRGRPPKTPIAETE